MWQIVAWARFVPGLFSISPAAFCHMDFEFGVWDDKTIDSHQFHAMMLL
jgi:hypothetical protein